MAYTKKLAKLSLASLFVMGTVLTACGTKDASPTPSTSATPQASTSATSSNGIDTSKEVKLKMVLLGSKPKAFDEVYGEVNKIMKQKINATLDVSFLDWGEYQQKYPLMFAANEDFDLVFSATWSYYAQQATKNGYMELTEDMIKKFAPKTWAEEPKVAWEQAKINGKIYMVPQNNFEYSYHMVGIRGDLRQKYNLPELKTYDDYVTFLKTVAEKEKDFKPSIGVSEFNAIELVQPNEWNFVVPQLPVAYKVTDGSGKLFNYVDTPEFADFAKKMNDTQKTGAWSRDAIANKVDKTQAFKDGKLASVEWNLGTLLRAKSEMLTTHPDWKVELYDLSADKKRLSNPFINNGMSIHAGSKNYERGLMAIDLLRYDPEIHDLTNYGIKGKHYEPVGNDQFKPLPASADFPPSGTDPWGWNSLHERLDSTVAAETQKFTENWKKTVTVNHPLETFTFDDTKVKNEVAAVSNVMETYGKPLFYGLVDPNDDKHGLKVFNDKLKQAGIDKVVAEMQNQANPLITKK
ncbi:MULTISPECIES: ABC transporter substrate-binding protein [unclassified Paenibacillus]|uniref:ABC transporter substrate-binding protein n=1 Tax=unclassified Paenibacillus TaxID=185978 RepID=UPI0007107764|nr:MULTISPECIES: ABC transporter substrate-binding protein [unclassified Paenibacillus]KQX64879.1 ABC transporter substrate-binding protein [Paenibacillus sp. Root444D2]KRE52129.1 ABC transporter substrate-binding protein [Paenibacillus sp. Soil724D2]